MSTAIYIRRATEQDAPAIAQLSTTLGYSAESSVVAVRLRTILASKAD